MKYGYALILQEWNCRMTVGDCEQGTAAAQVAA